MPCWSSLVLSGAPNHHWWWWWKLTKCRTNTELWCTPFWQIIHCNDNQSNRSFTWGKETNKCEHFAVSVKYVHSGINLTTQNLLRKKTPYVPSDMPHFTVIHQSVIRLVPGGKNQCNHHSCNLRKIAFLHLSARYAAEWGHCKNCI